MVTRGTPCLGLVTHTGGGALCPTYGRGCFGCFGPADTTNAPSLSNALAGSSESLERLFSTFNVEAPAFKAERERLVTLRVPKGNAAAKRSNASRSGATSPCTPLTMCIKWL